MSIAERTFRRETVARSNTRVAREDERNGTAGASSGSIFPTLVQRALPLRALAIVAALVLLAGCSNPISSPVNRLPANECLASLDQPTLLTSVHVQPDAGYEPVVSEIEHAKCTIDLSVYMLTDDTIVDALESAERRGVRVRVQLEQETFGTYSTANEMYENLANRSIEVKWAPAHFEYSHAKYMVVDASVLLISNQNYTSSGFTSNREFGVVTTDPVQVRQAQAIFEADWESEQFAQTDDALVVSPGNARDQVLQLINGSQVHVWLYAEVLRDDEVTAALDAAAERGVDVRILVNASTDDEDAPYFLDAMQHGVQVRVLEDPYVHAKLLVVDGSAALIGSHNYSYTSLELNREVGLIVTDAPSLERVMSVYERDWSRAVPVDTISLTSGIPTYRMYVQSLGADRRIHVC